MVNPGYTPMKKIMIILDIALTIGAFILAYYIRNSFLFDEWEDLFDMHQYLWVFWIIVPIWPIVIKQMGLYNGVMHAKFPVLVFSVLKSVLVGSLIIASAIFVVRDALFSRLFFAMFVVVDFFLLLIEKLLLRYLYVNSRKKYNDIRVVLVSSPEGVRKFKEIVSSEEDVKVTVLGYFTISNLPEDIAADQCLGTPEELTRYIMSEAVDEVIFVLPKNHIGEMEGYIVDCEEMGVTVRMLLDLYDLKLAKTRLSYLGHIPLLTFHTVSLNEDQKLVKRTIDILGAAVGLCFTGLIYLILGPIIKLESPGPIIYSQTRVGQNGRTFRCYKFRTMVIDADHRKKDLEHLNMMKGAMFKIEKDPRITGIGHIMRKLSLDEFPQFYNVLKGEMSLVGTRPPTVDEVECYEQHHRRRLSIRPGITGLWQVSGRNSIEDFDEIVALDVKYIDNWSIWLDVKILLKTVFAVFRSTGL